MSKIEGKFFEDMERIATGGFPDIEGGHPALKIEGLLPYLDQLEANLPASLVVANLYSYISARLQVLLGDDYKEYAELSTAMERSIAAFTGFSEHGNLLVLKAARIALPSTVAASSRITMIRSQLIRSVGDVAKVGKNLPAEKLFPDESDVDPIDLFVAIQQLIDLTKSNLQGFVVNSMTPNIKPPELRGGVKEIVALQAQFFRDSAFTVPAIISGRAEIGVQRLSDLAKYQAPRIDQQIKILYGILEVLLEILKVLDDFGYDSLERLMEIADLESYQELLVNEVENYSGRSGPPSEIRKKLKLIEKAMHQAARFRQIRKELTS